MTLDRYVAGKGTPLSGRRFTNIPNVILLGTVGSTNDFAKELIEYLVKEGEGIVPTAVAAERQTDGRGRLGRSWTTPPGASLALSLVVPWPEGPERVRLPIAIGIGLAHGLRDRLGVDVRLKWPNDLYVGRQKLGGILVEARALDDEEGFAIVGVGLNLTASRAELDAAGLPEATSLLLAGVSAEALQGEAPLITALEVLDEALGDPSDAIPEDFATVALHNVGDPITVTRDDGTVTGSYLGVTEDGMLRLDTGTGEETVVSGDVTLF